MNDLTPLIQTKFVYLKNLLKETSGCIIAFSGGIDSTFLVQTAFDALDGNCLAVIGDSPTYPRREYKAAVNWLTTQGINFEVVTTTEHQQPAFRRNPPDRCFYCKTELFSKIKTLASKTGFNTIIEGSNLDDLNDHRPGHKANRKLGILSPMIQAGLTKQDIRSLAKQVYQLANHDKPASACLSSRFLYGTEITVERLALIEKIEDFLKDQGCQTIRARYHQDLIRLEVGSREMNSFAKEPFRNKVINYIKSLGINYITLDLEGFRSGSSNSVLTS